MEIRKISREAAAALPRFRSHREARLWFKLKYGDAFEIDDSFAVGEGSAATVCYRYSLILDREVYERGLLLLMRGELDGGSGGPRTALGECRGIGAGDFLESYQTIEVMLDGSIHVIH